MGMEGHTLHVFFFPFMAHGHMIPTIDMAKLFASRGVKSTIVTTPLNAPFFSKTIQKCRNSGLEIDTQIVKFPSEEVGLPPGCENADFITSEGNYLEMVGKFFAAMSLLQEPLEKLLREFRPSCLIADMFFPWATDAATKFGVPRLVFHGTSFFSLCVGECLRVHEPHKKVSSDSETFLLSNFPGNITLTRSQLPDHFKKSDQSWFSTLSKDINESERKSYGTIFNSFYELEPDYADYFRNVMGRMAWHIGPVSLCNGDYEDKLQRGKDSSINHSECLGFLDSKRQNSVIYVCFGSVANFSASQLKQIAVGLESSGQQFIWVVRKTKNSEHENEWLPEGFETRMAGKGLIIRGWAPQVLILDHEAIGGFLTHCGWNSMLEGITAGKPMVTWPVAAEQFYNEKLVTQVLKTGVPVGVRQWVRLYGDNIESEAVEKAVKRVIVGEEAEEMRGRAKALKELAKKAVQEGGTSYNDLINLIKELKELQKNKVSLTLVDGARV